MKTALVGYTGFVGSNIILSKKIDYLFNSRNIEKAFGLEPDLLIYSAVKAEMFLANKDAQKDLELIINATENIRKINPKKIILISTVAVYNNPVEQSEDAIMKLEGLSAYGRNRYFLECWVRSNYKEHLIVRLPAIFGTNLKKNFIYDFIHYIPSMLNENKYNEFNTKSEIIKEFYKKQENGFYVCQKIDAKQKQLLKKMFSEIGFSALNFTDSRSVYQFYHLKHLWNHIERALNCNIKVLNIVTEPVSIAELFCFLTGETFKNHLSIKPFHYDLKTNYSDYFGGKNGYIYDKNFVMKEIKEYVEEQIDAES